MSNTINDEQSITVAGAVQHVESFNDAAEVETIGESFLGHAINTSYKPREGNALRRNWWKLLLSFLVTLAVIATGIAFLVVRPRQGASPDSTNNITKSSTPKYNWPTRVQYDANLVPILPQLDPSFLNGSTANLFQNPTQPANNNTPPLNSPFPYKTSKIRGVNLRGWLTLDPLVSPSFFNSAIPDEQTLCKSLGNQATNKLLEHYDNFISETDFAEIASIGMNHVRIPLGYWAIDPLPDESYVQLLSWQFLLRGIYWARKHGLRVFVVIQWLPGRPNPFPHQYPQKVSPDTGLNVTDSTNRALGIVTAMANFFSNSNYTNVVPLLGPVNEPSIDDQTQLLQFYADSYNATSNAYNRTNQTQAPVVFNSGPFQPSQFSRDKIQMLDQHNYVFFDTSVQASQLNDVLQKICINWGRQLLAQSSLWIPTIVGEWVASMDNCTTYLYGVNTPSSSNCTGQNDLDSQRKNIKMLADVQIDAFETYGNGWFYYNWKTENNTINPKFNYQFLAQNDFVPKGSFHLDYTCANYNN